MDTKPDDEATEWTGDRVGDAYRYDSFAGEVGVCNVYCETERSSLETTRKLGLSE